MSIVRNNPLKFVAVLSAAVVMASCSADKQPDSASQSPTQAASPSVAPAAKPIEALKGLKIVAYGPSATKAGEAFNTQPDGASAVWAKSDRNLEGYDAAIWLDGVRLGNAGISTETVTGTLPAGETLRAGAVKLEIRIGQNGELLSSEPVSITVE